MNNLFKASFLIPLTIISALGYIYTNTIDHNYKFVLKPLATLLVILVAVFSAKSTYKTHIVLGLVFCLIGDVALLFPEGFILGLIAFLIGHIIFLKAFISLYGFQKNSSILIGLVIYAGAFFSFAYKDLGGLLIPVVFYMLGILLMAWQGLSLLALKKSRSFVYIGLAVILFVVSDSILAIDKFKMSVPYANILIGVTYWTSITLLSLSITPIFYARNRT